MWKGVAIANTRRMIVDEEVKQQLWQTIAMLIKHGQGLDDILGRHIRLKSADVLPKVEEPHQSEAKVVCEVEVGDGAYPYVLLNMPFELTIRLQVCSTVSDSCMGRA